MKVFLDTSVLVSAVLKQHIFHERSFAVLEGVIQRPMRIFAPGFGAGSVAGYAVMRVDPRIVAPEPARIRTGSSNPR